MTKPEMILIADEVSSRFMFSRTEVFNAVLDVLERSETEKDARQKIRDEIATGIKGAIGEASLVSILAQARMVLKWIEDGKIPHLSIAGHDPRRRVTLPDREVGGRIVRESTIECGKNEGAYNKTDWSMSWERLPEHYKEAYRRTYEAIVMAMGLTESP